MRHPASNLRAGSANGTDGAVSRKPASTLRRRAVSLSLAAALTVSSAGCVTPGAGGEMSREDQIAIATVGGAVIGGLIGYEFFGTDDTRILFALGLGAAGAYGGQLLAQQLTRYDRTSMQETAYNTLSAGTTGETSTWQNTNTGTHGSITPRRTFLDSQGRICREYDAAISVDGQEVSGSETACLTDAGHWVVYSTTG
ncbi:MAG: RT0821/Lpp0805 family surface protein [Alphaproteobacteria bacterium]